MKCLELPRTELDMTSSVKSDIDSFLKCRNHMPTDLARLQMKIITNTKGGVNWLCLCILMMLSIYFLNRPIQIFAQISDVSNGYFINWSFEILLGFP